MQISFTLSTAVCFPSVTKSIMAITSSILREHERLSRCSPAALFFNLFGEYVLVVGAMWALLQPLRLQGRADIEKLDTFSLVAIAIVLAPVIETLLFQVLFSALARILKAEFWLEIAIMTVPFALAHFQESVRSGILAGCVAGFYLSYIYGSMRRISYRKAYWMTVGFHSLNNGIVMCVDWLMRQM
jgi:hypothetical protein